MRRMDMERKRALAVSISEDVKFLLEHGHVPPRRPEAPPLHDVVDATSIARDAQYQLACDVWIMEIENKAARLRKELGLPVKSRLFPY